MTDTYLEAFKENIPVFWEQTQDQFSFALACYLQGRIDKESMNDPHFNAVYHMTRLSRNQDDSQTHS